MPVRPAVLFALVLAPLAAAAPPGDRRPDLRVTFPPEAYFHAGRGGTVLDVTKAPFHAAGDGKTDDTAAFVRAYDFILAEQDKVGYSGTAMLIADGTRRPNPDGFPADGPPASADSSFIVYIPDGTYRVTDTIIYSMPDRTPAKRRGPMYKGGAVAVRPTGWEKLIWARFVGESREGATIRLDDRAAGFGPGAEKAVLSFGKSPFNNRKALSCAENLTIDTGRGNPGAVGVDFTGANSARLANLTVRSADGAGAAGILLKRPPVLGLSRDLTVDGFDVGIFSRVGHASFPVFEYVTLKNQRSAGIRLTGRRPGEGGRDPAALAARKVRVEDCGGPALEVAGEGAHLVAVDCDLKGRGPAAVNRADGAIYLHDVTWAGYAAAVAGGPVGGPGGERFVDYCEPARVGPAGPVTHLPAVEAPPPFWPAGPDEWATPEAFGAVGADNAYADAPGEDDTAAVQAAFDSGKPCVFLPSAGYQVSRPISVPASVTWVCGLWRYNPGLTFKVAGDAPDPVTFTQCYRGDVRHEGPRAVHLDFAALTYRNTPAAAGGTLFVSNGTYPAGNRNPAGVAFHGRSVNNEGKGLPLRIGGGGPVWMLGLKTERGPALRLTGGARAEILGATFGVKTGGPTEPAVRTDRSALTLVANKSADRWDPDQVVIETAGGGAVRASDLPPREPGDPAGGLIPLYSADYSAEP